VSQVTKWPTTSAL